jgi:branched-subunit amino acid transport protein
MWAAVVVTAVGCYALKLGGVSLPRPLLERAEVQRVAALLPVAMLTALVTVQLVAHGQHYALDWPLLAGTAMAVVALLLRRGLLVVFVVAVVVTAVLRHL